jgi:hypothetical protein
MRESGHEVKGHEKDEGPISAMFSVSVPSLSQSIAPPSVAGTNGAWIGWPLPLPRQLPLPLPTTSASRAIAMSTSVSPNGGLGPWGPSNDLWHLMPERRIPFASFALPRSEVHPVLILVLS